MAVTLSLIGRKTNHANVTTGLADVVTKLTVSGDLLTITPRTNAAKLVTGTNAAGLTDGGSLGATDYVTLTANDRHEIQILGGVTVLYITAGTPSTVVECMVEGEK